MDEKVLRIQINFPHSDANVNIVSCLFFLSNAETKF